VSLISIMSHPTPDNAIKQPKNRPARLLAKMPIAYKLALLFTLLISSSMILLGVIITHNHSRLIDQQYLELGETVAKQMVESAKDSLLANDPLALEVIANNLLNDKSVLGVALYSEQGEALALAGVAPRKLSEEALQKSARIQWQHTYRDGGIEKKSAFVAPALFKDVVIGYGLITLSQSKMRQAQQQIIKALGITTAILLIFGTIISLYLGRRVTRPITNMAKASASIDHGEMSEISETTGQPADEVERLFVSFSKMQEGMRQRGVLEESFSRYVSPSLAKTIVHDTQWEQLGGRYVDASVLFADVVGFTQLSEKLPPDELSTLLNDYFSYISKAADFFQGHVDKYIGDCAMLLFGVPDNDSDHRYHAISCAVVIQKLIALVNQHRQRHGLRILHFHIGVNSGRMLAGNIGSPERMNYTVIGDTVNLASRLASAAESNQTIITQQLLDELSAAKHTPAVIPHGTLKLRGKKEPVETYWVTDIGDAREQCYQLFKKALISNADK